MAAPRLPSGAPVPAPPVPAPPAPAPAPAPAPSPAPVVGGGAAVTAAGDGPSPPGGQTVSQMLQAAEKAFTEKVKHLQTAVAAAKRKKQKLSTQSAFAGAYNDVKAGGAAAGPAALRANDGVHDTKALKLALFEKDTEWDAAKGEAFIVQLPDFGYDLAAGQNNAVTVRLKYHELDSTDRLYAAFHVCSSAEVTPSTVYAHFVFRRDPRGYTASVAYKLSGGEWKGSQVIKPTDDFPFTPDAPFFVRVAFTPEGFFVYHDNRLLTARRQPVEAIPAAGTPMYLNLPVGGDAGEKSVLQCTNAWFGMFAPTPMDASKMPRPREAVKREFEPGKLWVTGLPADVGRRELSEHFAAFAPEDVDLVPSKFAATVSLADKSVAGVEAAVAALHNSMFMGQKIAVRQALARK